MEGRQDYSPLGLAHMRLQVRPLDSGGYAGLLSSGAGSLETAGKTTGEWRVGMTTLLWGWPT